MNPTITVTLNPATKAAPSQPDRRTLECAEHYQDAKGYLHAVLSNGTRVAVFAPWQVRSWHDDNEQD